MKKFGKYQSVRTGGMIRRKCLPIYFLMHIFFRCHCYVTQGVPLEMNVIIVNMIICEKTAVAFTGRKDYDVSGSEGISFCILHNLHRSPCNDIENPALWSSFKMFIGRWNVNFAGQ